LLVVLLSLTGCGGKRTGFVTGKVTYQGRPLTSGAITFHGEDGRTDSGAINAEGNYVVPNAPTGAVKVTVVVRVVKSIAPPRSGPGGTATKHPDEGKQPRAPAVVPVVIPARYEDPDKSGLTFQVRAGKQTIDVPLE
jgi:hypothetical protein